MVREKRWWVILGYYPFDAGEDNFPHTGQVIKYYRNAANISQAEFAQQLHLSKNAVRCMQNYNVGLDSLSRRYQAMTLFHIPPELLGLDVQYWQGQKDQSWWIQQGYPSFRLDDDGYPHAGSIIKYHRKALQKSDGKTWTQADCAEALEMTEKAVRAMENDNVGMDSLSRRRLLATMFRIPPALLGLASLEELLKHSFSDEKRNIGAIIQTSGETLNTSEVDWQEYRAALNGYWQLHHTRTAEDTLREILVRINHVHQALPYLSGEQERGANALLCQYHIAAGSIMDPIASFNEAIAHLNLAVQVAKKLENKELYAAALYRRGGIFFDNERYLHAVNDYDLAREYQASLSVPLREALVLKAGYAHAKIARDETERNAAIALLDSAGNVIRRSDPALMSDDRHFLKLNIERYYLDKGAALIAIGRPSAALDELALVAAQEQSNLPRRYAYSNLLHSQAYADKGFFPIATSTAIDALDIMQEIHSSVNIVRIRKLYEQLKTSSYGNNPEVARLGWKLKRR